MMNPVVIERLPGGRYVWQCDDCKRLCLDGPARGPRRSVCRSCKNVRAYRKRQPAIRRRTRQTERARHGAPESEREGPPGRRALA